MNQNRELVQEVNKRPGNIKRGMMMSYRYNAETYHLEVITSGAVGESRLWGLYEDDDKTTFRSRGGGRGEGGDGIERQGDVPRTLTNPKLKIFRLNH